MAKHSIQIALQLMQMPWLGQELRRQPVPDDVLDLIKVAAGCRDICLELQKLTGRKPEVVRAAAMHYLHAALLFPGAPPARVLGLRGSEAREIALRHKRWLIKWLHPDVNGNVWEAAQMARVVTAWNDVNADSRVPDHGAFEGLLQKGMMRPGEDRRGLRPHLAAPPSRTATTTQVRSRARSPGQSRIVITILSAMAITGIAGIVAMLQDGASDAHFLEAGKCYVSEAPGQSLIGTRDSCRKDSLAVCSNAVVER